MRVSISKARLFKSCRRAYELRYIEGLVPVTASEALETGRSYHSWIEELYQNGCLKETDYSKAAAMAKAYEKYVYPQFEVKAVEEWFEYDLCPEHQLVGRVDGIANNDTLVEHKTTSADLASYEYDLEWDEQMLSYMLAYGVNKMIYTVIRKPTIRQKKSEADEEFYQRMIDWYAEDTDDKIRCMLITRTDEELAQFKKDLIRLCDEMERAEAMDILYKNPAYCHRWNTLCEFAQICNHYDPDEEYINFTKVRKKENHADNETESEQW